MDIEAKRKLTEIRNNAQCYFCFYGLDNKEGVSVLTHDYAKVEDVIFEVLNRSPELLEMFEAIIDEIYEFRAEQN